MVAPNELIRYTSAWAVECCNGAHDIRTYNCACSENAAGFSSSFLRKRRAPNSMMLLYRATAVTLKKRWNSFLCFRQVSPFDSSATFQFRPILMSREERTEWRRRHGGAALTDLPWPTAACQSSLRIACPTAQTQPPWSQGRPCAVRVRSEAQYPLKRKRSVRLRTSGCVQPHVPYFEFMLRVLYSSRATRVTDLLTYRLICVPLFSTRAYLCSSSLIQRNAMQRAQQLQAVHIMVTIAQVRLA